MSGFSLGIDIGGTFTDIVALDEAAGRHWSRKLLTTHGDPAEAVLDGVGRLIAEDGVPPAAIGRVVHATTLFTNALIERKGAVTGLIASAGFRDVLEIGRERKYELYDIGIEKPAPLVPRRLRLDVPERIRWDGSVETPLDVAALGRAVERLVDMGAESLAIAFLHAYADPTHERLALDVVESRHPKLPVSLSSQVAPEIREYERVSTTVVNAYVKPLATRYLDGLAAHLGALGIGAPLLLMLSNGGLTNLGEAKRVPVRLLESGPAAGALAAAWFGREDGGARILAFDMGGTTAKLSVVDDGRPLVAYGFEAARQKRFVEGSGLPVRISAIELIEIGAGGGSIARVDALGLLKTGPDSAGSEPGPAAYGRGGAAATVTDADFALGHLDPGSFAGGTFPVDMDACRAALARLAGEAGLAPDAAAAGIRDVVDETMASAARVHIAERGRDPRGYTLLATGGAGPLHAWSVARRLGLKRIVCPPSAGVASALGLLVAPARVDRVATIACPLAALDWPALEAAFRRIEAEARVILAETDLPPADAAIERLADMRCVGQAFELVLPLPPGPYSAESRTAIEAAFRRAYLETFTRAPPPVPIEIINIRIAATVPVASRLAAAPVAGERRDPRKGERPVWFAEWGGARPAAVYDRYRLAPGDAFDGPAIVEERESTALIGPGGRFEITPSGNLRITLP